MTRLTHILALMLALVLGWQSSASAAVTVCRMSGAPMKGCPCAPAHGSSQDRSDALFEADACCEVIEAASAAETSNRSTTAAWAWEHVRAPHATTELGPVRFGEVAAFRPVEFVTEPDGSSSPIYLRLRQLLI